MISPMRRFLFTSVFSVALASGVTGCGATTRSARAQSSVAVAAGASERGLASYYSDSLEGDTTANGEAYDPGALTAAHRTLPFGARVLVQRVDNGRSVIVRVNDRGPYAGAARIIDLSRASAEVLHMIRAGVVRVRLEVLSLPARSRRASR